MYFRISEMGTFCPWHKSRDHKNFFDMISTELALMVKILQKSVKKAMFFVIKPQ